MVHRSRDHLPNLLTRWARCRLMIRGKAGAVLGLPVRAFSAQCLGDTVKLWWSLILGPFAREPSCVGPLARRHSLQAGLGPEFWPRIYQYMPWDGTQYPSPNFGMVHDILALMGRPIVY